ncbi:MAG: transglycosylase domain-containing protein, partial [Paracoccaceae bacterium]|nr:transglycosylase domain-containing protein [Paracoccaceae bacterium]
MTRFILSFFGAIFTWATNGAFMGALVVGGVFWSYGRDLPNHEQLAQYTPPTISRVYSGEGRLMDEFARERRLFAPGEEIPELIKHAFISAEDKNFYVHSGYDVRGMAAAALQAARGGRLRGASTISQQVVKNFLLSSDRSAERKIKELILSIRLEQTLTKEQILELYLNEIFLGQNSYGVAAAAQTYFNKVLSDLTAGEAAYLAALAQRPGNLHPIRQHEAAINRRNYVLREMLQNGYVDQAMHDVAREEPLRTVQNGDFESFRAQLPYRDYFTDEIRRQLSRDFGEEEFFGGGLTIRATVDPKLQDEGGTALREALESYDRAQGNWHGSGEKIADELLSKREDWEPALRDLQMPRDIPGWYPAVVLQVGKNAARIGIDGVADDDDGHWILAEDVTWASKELEDGSIGRTARVAGDLLEVGDVVMVAALAKPEDGSFLRWSLRQVPKVEGAFMAMDVNTGRVLAMQGGFSYQSSVFNRTTQATRQPGSSFKPFVYASALDSGFTPATIIVDAPIDFNTPEGIWRPKNAANRYYGPTPLRTGIEKSRNLMTIRLAQEVGMRTIANYAERFGVYDDFEPNLAGALGAQETTLFRMVAAYAMFANGGERVEPTLVDRVQDRRGKTIYRHDRRSCEDCQLAQLQPGSGPLIISNRERVMDAITAYQLTSMM